MTPDSSLRRRLKFLNEAAHLTTLPSPSIAATIGQARDRLLVAQDEDLKLPEKEWDALRRECCGACGNKMVPGWSCKVSRQLRSQNFVEGSKKKPPSASERPVKVMIYTCSRCQRETEQNLSARPPRHLKKGGNPKGDQMSGIKSSESKNSKVTKSANATSKQRAKSRKGGLQALLTQNKKQDDGLGLDLMDFMK